MLDCITLGFIDVITVLITEDTGEGNGDPPQCSYRIPRAEEPGRLQSMGSQRVRHN